MKLTAPVLCFAVLAAACGAWAGGRALEDDVTFLVLKFGDDGGRRRLYASD